MMRTVYLRGLFLLLCCGTSAVGLPSASSGAADAGTRWALLVGIDDYQSQEVNDLQYAVRDVWSVAEALNRHAGFPRENIVCLTSGVREGEDAPTNVNVTMRLDELAVKMKEQDTFLFYFSGHGFSSGDQNFLGTINTEPRSLSTLKISSLPLSALREQVGTLKAQNRFFVLDMCRNNPLRSKGASNPGRSEAFTKDLVEVAQPLAPRRGGTALLFSCGEGEESLEWPEKRQGLFTYYFLEGLSGKAADPAGMLSATSLGKYVETHVPQSEYLKLRRKQQNPDFQQFGSAEILLAKAPEAATTTASARPPQPPQPGEVRRNPVDGAEMVWIPAGEFLMGTDDWSRPEPRRRAGKGSAAAAAGDPSPAHRVRVDGFWLYRHEVTVAQYTKFAVETRRRLPRTPEWGWHYDHPVAGVTWEDSEAYCKWAGVRLPTEAEWERAARGKHTGLDGTPQRRYPWGDDLPRGAGGYGNLPDVAWARKYKRPNLVIRGYLDRFPNVAPVGRFPANELGIHDLEGNVREWCADWYSPDYYRTSPKENPRGPASGTQRVARGGSWGYGENTLAVYFRFLPPDEKNLGNVGFRPACTR